MVEALPEIADAIVVHLEEGDELILFVVLRAGATLDDALRGRIARELRAALSPRHVPDRIVAIPAVPRTLSGKKLEVPVKRILTGTPGGARRVARVARQPRQPGPIHRVPRWPLDRGSRPLTGR